MKLNVPFSELKDIISAKAGQHIDLTTVTPDTVNVGYDAKVKVPILGEIQKRLDVKVTFLKMEGDDLYLSYDAGMGLDWIIGAASNFIPVLKDKTKVEFLGDSQIVIHLRNIEQVGPALDQIAVQSLGFEGEQVALDFAVK